MTNPFKSSAKKSFYNTIGANDYTTGEAKRSPAEKAAQFALAPLTIPCAIITGFTLAVYGVGTGNSTNVKAGAKIAAGSVTGLFTGLKKQESNVELTNIGISEEKRHHSRRGAKRRHIERVEAPAELHTGSRIRIRSTNQER